MSDLTENFNKSSAMDPARQLEQQTRGLDPDQLSIFRQMQNDHARDYLKRQTELVDQRPERTAGFANHTAGAATFEHGTDRLPHPVTPGHVRAMMARAEREQLPLDQLTPTNPVELHIIPAWRETLRFEQQGLATLSAEQLDMQRTLMDDLRTLDMDQFRQKHERTARIFADSGRSLSDEFNHRSR